MACIGEPISWPRLERFALDAGDPAIAAHLAACPACRDCLAQIQHDVVELPPLFVRPPGMAPDLAPPRARRRWLAPGFVAAAAAAVALIVLLRPAPEPGFGDVLGIKGVGEVTLELVRERAGAIQLDARRYAPGDRWKVMLSCPPRASAVAIDVSVADGLTTDHPLAPARIACGNRVVVPGAFTITGTRANRVCARVGTPGGDAPTVCATLQPDDAP